MVADPYLIVYFFGYYKVHRCSVTSFSSCRFVIIDTTIQHILPYTAILVSLGLYEESMRMHIEKPPFYVCFSS